jgi:Arc/MetJ-type ribon-helix-helix transcriptional regulator
MMEGSDKTKTRVSVTLTRPYLDAMNRLVEEGVYMSKGTIIVEALRSLLRRRGIEPFARSLEEKGET